jgi:sulfide dehydrogenase [flavocytochrome c] flavoprotein chain
MIRHRNFIKQGANTASLPANSRIRDQVVVIGTGTTGATIAKFLSLWNGDGVEITLIDREIVDSANIAHVTAAGITHPGGKPPDEYSAFADRYGIRIIGGRVVSIDPIHHLVTLADGRQLSYDRLEVAPGAESALLPPAVILD